MVGLVLVSHSRPLARALQDFLRQVTPPSVPLAIAAGVGDERSEFGTDALEISEAIQSVYSDSGVLVLMDLGSAVLSTQLALDLLPPELVANVRICAAPLVEGAVAAGVQAGLNSDLTSVHREASGALRPKQEQVGETPDSQPEETSITPEASEAALSTKVVLTNLHGLHARPAAQFVQTASQFKAEIRVTNLTNGKGPVTAKSLNALAMLGAVENHTIEISADGSDAPHALAALEALVGANFGEPAAAKIGEPGPAAAAIESPPADPGAIRAVPVSDGIAYGPFYSYQPPLPPIPQESTADPAAEWQRFQAAQVEVRQALRQRRSRLQATIGAADAAIFEAHSLLLDDPETTNQVRRAIEIDKKNAARAWSEAMDAVAEAYRSLEDPYMQQRAADVLDVRNQLLFVLAGKQASAAITLEQPVILFAPDITPSETSQLDMSRVLGLMTVAGGPTSHSAILARALGIPAVTGVGAAVERLKPGTPVALDGFQGIVWVDPPPELREQLSQRREGWLAERRKLKMSGQEPAVTRDGQRIEVFANIGSTADAHLAVENGAEGVGLLRTEFLFLTRETPPTEAEQYAALQQIGAAMRGRPVTARTLDVGGDKEVPYIQLPYEPNPFLGVRAIRLTLHDVSLFLPQLRAILRAGAEHPYRIMFPMVANVDEVRLAREWLTKAHAELLAEGVPHAWPIETGIMVEIPSAALTSPILAREVDFFSIGTNDLTQYTLAAERGNPMLAPLADALHPAVLRLIGEVVKSAHTEGKWVGVCGELAGDPVAAAPLIGLGVDELSLTAAGIPRIKSIIRKLDTKSAHSLAERLMSAESAAESRSLAEAFLNSLG